MLRNPFNCIQIFEARDTSNAIFFLEYIKIYLFNININNQIDILLHILIHTLILM